MKRLFTAISILFLTTCLYARDFIIPEFSNNSDEVLEKLKDEYDCEYDEAKQAYLINERKLFYYGNIVDTVAFIKNDDNTYTYILFMTEMEAQDWSNLITDIIYTNELYDYRVSKGEKLPFYNGIKYDIMYKFSEIEEGKNITHCVYIFRIGK